MLMWDMETHEYVFGVANLDTFGNAVTDYAGTVGFTSDDPSASLPANHTLPRMPRPSH